MYYVDGARWNNVVSNFINDTTKVLWACGSSNDIATHGHPKYITIGIDRELMVFGNKERLNAFVLDMQPQTWIEKMEYNVPYNAVCGFYEKPLAGSLGRDVSFIDREHIHRKGWKKERYLLQVAIEPSYTEVPNHKSDVRIWLMVSAHKPHWVSPSCIVRVCRKMYDGTTDSMVTNIARAEEAYPSLDYESTSVFYNVAKFVAEEFARRVQVRLAHSNRTNLWTILGLDVVLDDERKGWLLDVNTLPGFDQHEGTVLFGVYKKWMSCLLKHIHVYSS